MHGLNFACPYVIHLQLSIEDNDLTSLAGIEPLVNLMELYAGEGGGHHERYNEGPNQEVYGSIWQNITVESNGS